jgi:putative phage-type endonuclease
MIVYDVIPCEDRADWLRKRAQGIGASDLAAVMGVSNWRSPLELYLEKTGEIEPVDLSDVEAIEWGHKLEPIIIETFGERSGRLVRPSGQLLRSREYPWAQCTLDAETAETPEATLRSEDMFGRTVEFMARPYPRDGWVPLEAKTHSAFQIEDWADGAPEPYYIQVHQQMLVTGAPRGFIACLIGGARFVWQEIPRDEQTIRRIIWNGERFWQRVQDRNPPPPDGSESTARAVKRWYPEDDGSEVVLDEDLEVDAEELLIARGDKAAAEEKIRKHEARIRLAMGEAERGLLDEYRITLRTQERAGYVKVSPPGDLHDFAKEMAQQRIVAQVVKPSTSRPLRIKRTGGGEHG